jgi:SAM-dependent methyltransferase
MNQDPLITELTDAMLDAVARGQLVKLSLTKPTSTAGDIKSIDIRPIMVKRALMLSFTTHHRTRDVVKNYPPHEAAQLIASHLTEHFAAAELNATIGDMKLLRREGKLQLSHHEASVSSPPTLTHDRTKHRLISSEDKPYLHALGITDAKGVVMKAAQDKFRQISKYIEILDGLLEQLPPRDSLRIVDMGAGKGYLTFALYDYITHTLKRHCEMVGVEFRADLVAKCNGIAQAAGFTGLRFVEGSIAAYNCTGADVVIALHACDTATDDAIAKAVKASASLIVVAPCCHKQIRRSMGQVDAKHPLHFMLKHGTYSERMGEMLTDALRAQLMELHQYRTKLFEFIGGEHTPKNVMIVGVKSVQKLSDAASAALRDSIAANKMQFGIETHQLERLLSPLR